MDYKVLEDRAEVLKALAHPVRLCIAKGLVENGSCNVSYMQTCLELPQSTVSQHLQKLKSAGIIIGERKGLEVTYSVVNEDYKNIIKAITNNI